MASNVDDFIIVVFCSAQKEVRRLEKEMEAAGEVIALGETLEPMLKRQIQELEDEQQDLMVLARAFCSKLVFNDLFQDCYSSGSIEEEC